MFSGAANEALLMAQNCQRKAGEQGTSIITVRRQVTTNKIEFYYTHGTHYFSLYQSQGSPKTTVSKIHNILPGVLLFC